MKDLKNFNLIDFQNFYMQNDRTTKRICKALNTIYLEVARGTFLVAFYWRLDELEDEILDEIAWELDVDFYSNSLPKKSKVELIRKSNFIKQMKGTVGAVETFLASLFGRSKVNEWFDYNGEPYKFIVDIWNQNDVFDLLDVFFASIDKVKNVRSFLEKVNIIEENNQKIYIAAATQEGEEITIYPYSPDNLETSIDVSIPTGVSDCYYEITIRE